MLERVLEFFPLTEEAEEKVRTAEKHKILFVEDDNDFETLFKYAFSIANLDVEVFYAHSADAARDVLLEDIFDLLIVDCTPENCEKTLNVVGQNLRLTSQKRLPVIIMSASDATAFKHVFSDEFVIVGYINKISRLDNLSHDLKRAIGSCFLQ